MSEMYIRKHGYHTLYCTKHDGKELTHIEKLREGEYTNVLK